MGHLLPSCSPPAPRWVHPVFAERLTLILNLRCESQVVAPYLSFLFPGNQPIATHLNYSLAVKNGTYPGVTTDGAACATRPCRSISQASAMLACASASRTSARGHGGASLQKGHLCPEEGPPPQNPHSATRSAFSNQTAQNPFRRSPNATPRSTADIAHMQSAKAGQRRLPSKPGRSSMASFA